MSLTSQVQTLPEQAQTDDTDGNVEALRQILISQNQSEISHEDAKEVAAALIEFYEVLATEPEDESDN